MSGAITLAIYTISLTNIAAMASLRIAHTCTRSAASLLFAHHHCQCSVSRNVSKTGVVRRRSYRFHAAQQHHNQRPFHSTKYIHGSKSNDICDISDVKSTDNSIISNIEENQAQTVGESFTDIPGTTNTKGKTLAIIYTCKVCNTRSAKKFTEHAYKHGVVLVRCPGCQNLHLIADRLGWFEGQGEGEEANDGYGGWDVEKALAKAGENVKAVSGEDVLELTVDDILGNKT